MTDKIKEQEYRVLARKYRPQKFIDLIGQDSLVSTLTNSINLNRIAHAFLLTGVRGIGKTTSARLIAMSLNCESRSKDTCEPCGKCNSCESVREDRSLDVIEMDAASKTGVDDIREIIENVKYKPVSSKYKIFIIDEVHMLSKNAFNALLKTLEEPPAHIKFIFATTEAKKIPITIISRCQRFDLHRIINDELISHLISISKKEKIEIQNDAVILIARAADGSIRDGLSLLDQAISNGSEKITAELVTKMLGLADRSKIYDLIDAIFKGEAASALEIFNNIHKAGADVVMIFDEMLNVIHFITQIKISPKLKEDHHISDFERNKSYEISEKITMSSLGMIWQVLFNGYQELQLGYHLQQHGEMIIIRLIYLFDGPTPDDLIKKIEHMNSDENKNFKEKLISDNNSNSNVIINQTFNKNDNDNDNENENKNKNKNKKENTPKGNIPVKSFRHFVDLFYQKKEGMLHTYLYNNAKLISFKEGEVCINLTSIKDPNFSRTIAKLVSTWTGRIWQVTSSTGNIGKSLHEEDLIELQIHIEEMKNESDVKKILEKFPGVKIHSITNINETVDEDNSVIKIIQTKEK